MKMLSATLKMAPLVAVLAVFPGSTATADAIGAGNLAGSLQSLFPSLVEPAHCRPYWHSHRVCIRWRRGICRSWRVRRHRC